MMMIYCSSIGAKVVLRAALMAVLFAGLFCTSVAAQTQQILVPVDVLPVNNLGVQTGLVAQPSKDLQEITLGTLGFPAEAVLPSAGVVQALPGTVLYAARGSLLGGAINGKPHVFRRVGSAVQPIEVPIGANLGIVTFITPEEVFGVSINNGSAIATVDGIQAILPQTSYGSRIATILADETVAGADRDSGLRETPALWSVQDDGSYVQSLLPLPTGADYGYALTKNLGVARFNTSHYEVVRWVNGQPIPTGFTSLFQTNVRERHAVVGVISKADLVSVGLVKRGSAGQNYDESVLFLGDYAVSLRSLLRQLDGAVYPGGMGPRPPRQILDEESLFVTGIASFIGTTQGTNGSKQEIVYITFDRFRQTYVLRAVLKTVSAS